MHIPLQSYPVAQEQLLHISRDLFEKGDFEECFMVSALKVASKLEDSWCQP